MAMVRAIVAGERPQQALLELCNAQIRRRKELAVIEALRGTWADEHIFALAQALQSWDHYQKLIADVLPPHDETQPPLCLGVPSAAVSTHRRSPTCVRSWRRCAADRI